LFCILFLFLLSLLCSLDWVLIFLALLTFVKARIIADIALGAIVIVSIGTLDNTIIGRLSVLSAFILRHLRTPAAVMGSFWCLIELSWTSIQVLDVTATILILWIGSFKIDDLIGARILTIEVRHICIKVTLIGLAPHTVTELITFALVLLILVILRGLHSKTALDHRVEKD